MKTVCIYHSIDLDGWMSAAIVKHWFNDQDNHKCNTCVKYHISTCEHCVKYNQYKENIDFIGYTYGQPIPDLSGYDKVIMCDISFPKEELLKLNIPNDRLIWIDHHTSALKEFYETFDTTEGTNKFFKGLRSSKLAACELTWLYFFAPNGKATELSETPEIVRLLGMYDSFRHKGTDEEQKVLEFQYGARQIITNYEEAYRVLAMPSEHQDTFEYMTLESGKAIYKYLCTEAKQTYKNGFEIRFTDPTPIPINQDHRLYKFICINKERFNPINFGIDYHKEGYDGAACFHYSNDKWNFSLYNDNGMVDCSVITKQLGGGGHKGAAGFVCNNETMLKIINNQ